MGTETVKLLKRAWEEMLDTSVLAANIKHMIRLCVLAAGNVFSSSGAQSVFKSFGLTRRPPYRQG